MNLNKVKSIIKEEIFKIKENSSPTITPTKPKINPSTKPNEKPKKRRTLQPPRTAPQTTPKAKIKESDIEGFEINPEDTSSYGFKTFGSSGITNLVDLLYEIEKKLKAGDNKGALNLLQMATKELKQVGGGSQLNEDEKQIAKAMAKRFLSKRK